MRNAFAAIDHEALPISSEELTFELSDVEVETVRRAAVARGMGFDPEKRQYKSHELQAYGLVREGYNRTELHDRGIRPVPVSSLDVETNGVEPALPLDTPFAAGIKKFELPIDMLPMRVAKTIFPPGSVVEPHVHPPNSESDPGGSLRVVITGRLFYEGREYSSGDWFFVPNGVPYQFTSDPFQTTVVMYTYRFFAAEKGNRFSHPHNT